MSPSMLSAIIYPNKQKPIWPLNLFPRASSATHINYISKWHNCLIFCIRYTYTHTLHYIYIYTMANTLPIFPYDGCLMFNQFISHKCRPVGNLAANLTKCIYIYKDEEMNCFINVLCVFFVCVCCVCALQSSLNGV